MRAVADRILGQGAEAVVRLEAGSLGDGKNPQIIKDRIPKRYRHPELDERLRTQRTKYEERLLKKAATVTCVPKVLAVDGTRITMEYVTGPQVKELLDAYPEMTREIGRMLATLHGKNIIHGDLTTSNMIMTRDTSPANIYFIDFGLSYTSARDEDKAVDLHLFRQALESRHYRVHERAYRAFLKGYKEAAGDRATAVLERLKQVEGRGRNKAKW